MSTMARDIGKSLVSAAMGKGRSPPPPPPPSSGDSTKPPPPPPSSGDSTKLTLLEVDQKVKFVTVDTVLRVARAVYDLYKQAKTNKKRLLSYCVKLVKL